MHAQAVNTRPFILLPRSLDTRLAGGWPLGHSFIVSLHPWRHPFPKHPTSLFTSVKVVPRQLEVWGKTAHALFAAHNISGSLLSVRASMVYTCSTFSVLSKMMVFLSATVVQPGSVVIIVLTCISVCKWVTNIVMILTGCMLEHLLWWWGTINWGERERAPH